MKFVFLYEQDLVDTNIQSLSTIRQAHTCGIDLYSYFYIGTHVSAHLPKLILMSIAVLIHTF